MITTPVKPQTAADRHVQFSEFVDVRYITPMAAPTASTMATTTDVRPSLYAQRLERELRNRPCFEAQTQAQPKAIQFVETYKNVLHTVAMVCGALIIPSLACLIIGPIGLVAPAVLASLALTCALLAGRPTETMERIRAERAAAMSEYDPR